MTAPRQHAKLHSFAADEPLRNLFRATRIDRSIALTVQDEHGGANLGELVADDRA